LQGLELIYVLLCFLLNKNVRFHWLSTDDSQEPSDLVISEHNIQYDNSSE